MTKQKRNFRPVGVGAILTIGAILIIGYWLWFKRGEIRVPIDTATLQAAVTSNFPVENRGRLATITLRDPQVTLESETSSHKIIPDDRSGRSSVSVSETGQIVVAVTAEVRTRLGRAEGRVVVAGRPRYEPDTRAFFVDSPSIRRLDVKGVSSQVTKAALSLAGPALKAALKDKPLYRLDDTKLAERLTGRTLSSVRVSDDRLIVVFRLR